MPFAKRGRPDFLPLKRRLRSEMTEAEHRLWAALRLRQFHGLKFRRQHGIGSYILDFYCPEKGLVVEVDGDTHADPQQARRDRDRDASLRSLCLRVVRYTNQDVMENLEGVLEDLTMRVAGDSTSPFPSLRRRGEGGSTAAPARS